MKSLYVVLSILFFAAASAPAQEKHDAGEKHGHENQSAEAHKEQEGEEHEGAHGEEGHSEHGEEGEEVSSSVGPGNAVTAADPEHGLQLSAESIETLGIKTGAPPAVFPKAAIVTFKDEAGVYRLRDGWYKLVEGEIEARAGLFRFTPNQKGALRAGDQVVLEGAPLLRVAELDAFSGGDAGDGD